MRKASLWLFVTCVCLCLETGKFLDTCIIICSAYSSDLYQFPYWYVQENHTCFIISESDHWAGEKTLTCDSGLQKFHNIISLQLPGVIENG